MWSYLSIVAVAIIGHWTLPYPQEFVFASAGYIAASNGLNPVAAFLTVLLAAFADDFIFFSIARGGSHLLERLAVGFSAKSFADVRARLGRHAFVTIVLLRLFPLTRVLVTVVAGTIRVRPRTYAAADFTSLCINVPIFYLLGRYSFASFEKYLNTTETLMPWLYAAAITVLAYGVYFFVARRRRRHASLIAAEIAVAAKK